MKVARCLSLRKTKQRRRLRNSDTMNDGDKLEVGEYAKSASLCKPRAVIALAQPVSDIFRIVNMSNLAKVPCVLHSC